MPIISPLLNECRLDAAVVGEDNVVGEDVSDDVIEGPVDVGFFIVVISDIAGEVVEDADSEGGGIMRFWGI